MTRRVARARTLLVMGAVCLPATAVADALARYDAAARGVAAADAAYRRALVASLDADNEYERKRALEVVAAHPAIIDGDVAAALVRRLEETTPLQDAHCAQMIARLDRAYGGQGEELEYARCNMRGATSNGKLAATLLGPRRVFGAVAARVAQRPASVGAVLAALAPSQIGLLSELKPALDAAATADAQQALLRLAVAIDCGAGASPAPDVMAPIVALQSSHAPPVNRTAALGAAAPHRLRARCLMRSPALASAPPHRWMRGCGTSTTRTSRATWPCWDPTAAPFMPSLLARFDQAAGDRAQRQALVAVFRSAGTGASPATPRLATALRDPKQRYLQDETLAALSAIGPAAAGAKPALVALVTADPDYVPVDIVETLAANRCAPDTRGVRPALRRLPQGLPTGGGDLHVRFSVATRTATGAQQRSSAWPSAADTLSRVTGWREPEAEEDE